MTNLLQRTITRVEIEEMKRAIDILMCNELEKEAKEWFHSTRPVTSLPIHIEAWIAARSKSKTEIAKLRKTIIEYWGRYSGSCEEIKRLESENVELVKALEFYADKKNWYCSKGKETFMTIASLDTEGDTWHGGRAARKALRKFRG